MSILNGLYGDHLETVTKINKNYEIYEGKQGWEVNAELDYIPTQKITNYIKKLISTKARFMFGKEPFFDLRQIETDSKNSTTHKDMTQEKEDLLAGILKKNKFHSKVLKAYKDCSIGGKVAIKLWGHKEKGIKIIFSPAQEFFATYNIDDIDELEKVTFLYIVKDSDVLMEQRIKKQEWEMYNGRCILNEGIYNGSGDLVESIEINKNTGLDFIPIIIIQNGGLTGEVEGVSDVEELWSNQNAYNRLTSDDIDALEFQMFGQDVVTDADERSLKNITVAPGALIDLQTDITQANQGRQAAISRLESGFSYSDKYVDTINRTKNDMFDLMNVPNVSLEQLKGLMTSGKSMKALYWELMSSCDEDWVEWGDSLNTMVDYIFRMIDSYNCYNARHLARYETTLNVITTYPIPEDEDQAKKIDMEEVNMQVRSRESYLNKWNEAEDVEAELEQIQKEQQMLDIDNYTKDLMLDIEDKEDELVDTEEGE